MTDIASPAPTIAADRTGFHRSDVALNRLRRRYRAEQRFKWGGIVAIGIALAMLVWLLGSIILQGYTAFWQTMVDLDVEVDAETVLGAANYQTFAERALYEQFPDIVEASERRDLATLLDPAFGPSLSEQVVADPSLLGQTIEMSVPGSEALTAFYRGAYPSALLTVLTDNDAAFLDLIDTLRSGNALIDGPDGMRIELPIPLAEDFDPTAADPQALLLEGIGARFFQLRTEGERSAAADTLLGPGAADAVAAGIDGGTPGERVTVEVPASDQVAAIAAVLAEVDEPPRDLAQAKRQYEAYQSLSADGLVVADGAAAAIRLPVTIVTRIVLQAANYEAPINETLYRMFPEVDGRQDRRELRDMVSPGGSFELRRMVRDDPSLIGRTVSMTMPVSDRIDQLRKGNIDRTLEEARRPVSDQQLGWYDTLDAQGAISTTFNWAFFSSADSRQAELAGIWGAVVGSAYTLFITLILAFPIGVAAAIYLEEFAPKNRITDIIEVNINNLAAVPSIVFGLLGLAVFIQFFGIPRSAPVAGGMVLALMTLPTIIIASRAALKAVPPSIREAALGMGASRLQAVTHHVLPLAMPGVLTGTIIGMAQALGETAPLLMIGMVAFITSTPEGFTSPATVLPVQVYIWSDSPERGFTAKTSAAIMVLLAFLILMNGLAIWLRKKFERRW